MESSPSASSQPDVLKHILDDAEAELQRRLHEACESEAKGVSTESSAEIRRLEDALLAAAVAAEQTITMRRHLAEQPSPDREHSTPPTPTTGSREQVRNEGAAIPSATQQSGQQEQRRTEVREFRDSAGHAWRAWPVIPGLTRASATGRSFLGGFQHGWICFESLDSPARRRLPSPQPRWSEMTDEELRKLLAQAIDAPERASQTKDKR